MQALLHETLREACRSAAHRAAREGRARWVIWRLPAGPELERDAVDFRFEEPARRRSLVATGAAATLEAEGTGRFGALVAEAADLFEHAHVVDVTRDSSVAAAPVLVGGAAFSAEPPRSVGPWRDFPPARFVLPARLLQTRGSQRSEQRAVRVDPGRHPQEVLAALEQPDPPVHATPSVESDLDAEPADTGEIGYLGRVEAALGAIGDGELEKVVVARALDWRASRAFSTDETLAALRTRFPHCVVFAVRRASTTFLGATPERLIQVSGGLVRADALAGSAPRGADAAEDEALARALRESKKEQSEHAIVVRALREALGDVCGRLEVDEAPRVQRHQGIQHLHTRLTGRLAGARPFALFELAELLHPTPAVAGAPRPPALDWLRRHEALERGWYAGCLGWIDARGDGELSVALRAALVRGRCARLYAGAGIVAGSEPASELAETRLKLFAVRSALSREAP
jgi:isochorismate synthase